MCLYLDFGQHSKATAAELENEKTIVRNAAGDWGACSFGSSFLLGVAAASGAVAQGKATSAAAEGMSRNPGAAGPIRTMTIIGLAMIESLVLYALLIAFLIKDN